MKKVFVSALLVAGLSAGGFTVVHMANAAAAPPKPPKQIDVKTLAVSGGNPWPIGFGIAGGKLSTATFGQIGLTFPTPAVTDNVTQYDGTCTPKYKVAPAGAPTAPVSATFTNLSAASPNVDVNATAGTTTLIMPAYPGNVFPPLACTVTPSNLKSAGVLQAGKASKAPKLTTSPSADCGPLADASLFPVTFNALPPSPSTNTNFYAVKLHVPAPINSDFMFCTTTANTFSAKLLTDQATLFKSKVKVAAKTKAVTIDKLSLNAAVNSSIPLTVTAATVVFTYDPAKLNLTGCAVAAAKKTGTNTCVVGGGTITITSTDTVVVKPGKPITSPAIKLTGTYLGAPGTAGIGFGSAASTITVAGVAVDVVLQPLGTIQLNGISIPGQAGDANVTSPIVSLVGLV